MTDIVDDQTAPTPILTKSMQLNDIYLLCMANFMEMVSSFPLMKVYCRKRVTLTKGILRVIWVHGQLDLTLTHWQRINNINIIL